MCVWCVCACAHAHVYVGASCVCVCVFNNCIVFMDMLATAGFV